MSTKVPSTSTSKSHSPERLSVIVPIRMSQAEKNLLSEAARKKGVSLSVLSRELLFNGIRRSSNIERRGGAGMESASPLMSGFDSIRSDIAKMVTVVYAGMAKLEKGGKAELISPAMLRAVESVSLQLSRLGDLFIVMGNEEKGRRKAAKKEMTPEANDGMNFTIPFDF